MKEIVFKIDGDGNIRYETDGYEGDTCLEAAQALLQELAGMGVNVTLEDVQLKPDAYEDVEVSVANKRKALS